MAALGRILQIAGWLWVLAGIAGSMFDFESVNVFPGFVLIFIARILRARSRSEMPPAPGESPEESQPASSGSGRPEPLQQTPPPAPARVERKTPPAPKLEPESESEPEPKRPVQERNELLERLASASREAAKGPAGVDLDETESEPVEDTRTPMSSAEMIAQARQRWDRSER